MTLKLAGPDLLAALERVLESIDFERGAKGSAYEDEAEEILIQARNAVSKARTG